MKPMIAYVAAPFKRKPEAKKFAQELERYGVQVTSRWHTTHPDTDDPEGLAQQARDDLDDIDQADTFILLNFKGWLMEGQGGKHVETGYALAKGKRVIIVGKRWNVFHYLPEVLVVGSLEELVGRAPQRVGEEVI
jgi:nucleoside 2-deoxyribosyltransferase